MDSSLSSGLEMKRVSKGLWEFLWPPSLGYQPQALQYLILPLFLMLPHVSPLVTLHIFHSPSSLLPSPPSSVVLQEIFSSQTSYSASSSLSVSPSAPTHSLSVPQLPINLFIGCPLYCSSVSFQSPVLSVCLSAIHLSILSLSATLSLTLAYPLSRPFILSLCLTFAPSSAPEFLPLSFTPLFLSDTQLALFCPSTSLSPAFTTPPFFFHFLKVL